MIVAGKRDCPPACLSPREWPGDSTVEIGAPSAAGWAWTRTLQAIAILALAGCNGTLPPAPKEIRIPVPTPCVSREQIPTKDFMTDKTLGELSDFDFVVALRTDQLAQRAWIETTSALLEACIK